MSVHEGDHGCYCRLDNRGENSQKEINREEGHEDQLCWVTCKASLILVAAGDRSGVKYVKSVDRIMELVH
jgi:hypothetical protein